MEEEIELYLDDAKENMEKAIKHTIAEFAKIRAGRATPAMLDGLAVEYYGSMSPLHQVASIVAPDPRSIVIKPWEKNMVAAITKVLRESNLGLNPIAEADLVRLNIPPLSGERRQELVRKAKGEAEEGKIRVRAARKSANDGLKALQNEGAPEDAVRRAEEKVQAFTDQYIKKIDELLEVKEKDIMTV
ncbi:ribosome recycling factor [Hugenholtzia roseola]|uniref:ribosome recycling factor n=1 Tax=Hugenholtzia roseola TaxID=1002 RepID=UPI0004111F6D|nr:ribosome recycling factor [Hugenholtzia roseola]